MKKLHSIVLLTLFYLAVTSNLEPLNICAAVLISVGVSYLLQIEDSPLRWQETPRVIIALARYVLILAYDLVVSGFQVARIVLSRSMPIQQGVIGVPTDVETEMAAALSAHAITLTPGELVIEMDDDCVLYTHVLDATRSSETIQDAQEMREELLDKIVP